MTILRYVCASPEPPNIPGKCANRRCDGSKASKACPSDSLEEIVEAVFRHCRPELASFNLRLCLLIRWSHTGRRGPGLEGAWAAWAFLREEEREQKSTLGSNLGSGRSG